MNVSILPEGLVLTVNDRLARWLQLQYSRQQALTNHKVWETPSVYRLDQWLRDVWTQSWPDRQLFSSLQSETLWQTILQNDPEVGGENLIHIKGAATQAAEAYEHVLRYELPLETSAFQAWSEETKAFIGWLQAYRDRLREWKALDPAELLTAVQEAMATGRIPLPPHLVLAGFDELYPQLTRWIEFLQERGVQVEIWDGLTTTADIDTATATYPIYKCRDRKDEVRQCARWVRSVWKPEKTVGIVVPKMENYQFDLQHELTAELSPEAVYPWRNHPPPFKISLGTSLAREPLVRTALILLNQPTQNMPCDTFLHILKSPFLKAGGPDSHHVRSIEQTIYHQGLTAIQLNHSEILDLLQDANQIKNLLKVWNPWIESREKTLLPSEWAHKITETLKQLNWPKGEATLSSREFQTYEKWNECLNDFSSLDRVLGKVSRRQAMTTLENLIRDTLFQVKTPEQPIQVVGVLESAGMSFDHLWLLGCHNEAFPSIPSPNPFIPLNLQKAHNLPRTNAIRELELARNTLKRLIRASPDIVFSYPELDDNREMQPSPLLNHALVASPSFTTSHCIKDRLHGSAVLEACETPATHPLTPEERAQFESDTVKGGYRLLKDQAECPFRAFAAYRLRADMLELPEVDFDSRERGTLVHKALELFWKSAQNSTRLREWSDSGTLDSHIKKASQEALKEFKDKLDSQKRFKEIEEGRLALLLKEWLHKELVERSDFEVLNSEEEVRLRLGPVEFRLRVDRVDKMRHPEKGDIYILIDYKTGEAKPKVWFDERISEPQLPLYACAMEPGALAIARVRKGDCKLVGTRDPDLDIPGMDNRPTTYSDWPTTLQHWRKSLQDMVDEFLEGNIPVQPLHGEQTCRTCDFHSLCRIHELSLFHGNEEDA